MTHTLGIVCGGRSGEHEVSLQSARGITLAVERERFRPVLLAVDKQGQWRLGSLESLLLDPTDPARVRLNPAAPVVLPARVASAAGAGRLALLDATGRVLDTLDVAFPIIHGTDGEDGALQGWLRMAGVPFVGADVLGSAIGMDKHVMKRLLAQAGLPSARFAAAHPGEDFQALFERVRQELGVPVFVKPAALGSSVGVSRVTSRAEFEQALAQAFRYDQKVLVEEAVPGRELECSVLGNRLSPTHAPRASLAGEIRPKRGFYSYAAKYLEADGAELLVPAPLDAATLARVQALALRVFDVLECDGMARVDFFLRPDGQLLVNEINTLPGFTPISMYPKLWEASGLPFPKLVTQLVELALEREAQRRALVRDYHAT